MAVRSVLPGTVLLDEQSIKKAQSDLRWLKICTPTDQTKMLRVLLEVFNIRVAAPLCFKTNLSIIAIMIRASKDALCIRNAQLQEGQFVRYKERIACITGITLKFRLILAFHDNSGPALVRDVNPRLVEPLED